jgi:hypothetical protein
MAIPEKRMKRPIHNRKCPNSGGTELNKLDANPKYSIVNVNSQEMPRIANDSINIEGVIPNLILNTNSFRRFKTINTRITPIARIERVRARIPLGKTNASSPNSPKNESENKMNPKESFLEKTSMKGTVTKIKPIDQKNEALPMG